MNKYALIVAGGNGSRMESVIPKQFILIGNRPILMHTLEAFDKYSKDIKIILVLPQEQFANWHTLVEDHKHMIKHKLVAGGQTRFESVRNGLNTIENDGLVAIHDGVRPFISKQLIGACFNSAEKEGSGIACVIPKDSIRKVLYNVNEYVDRNTYRLIQTPQVFEVSSIKMAYSQTSDTSHTDDASVAEEAGQKIILVDGDYGNIKITTPEDISIAQALVNNFK